MTCSDGYNEGTPNGECPDCGAPTVDGLAASGCNYSPIVRKEARVIVRRVREANAAPAEQPIQNQCDGCLSGSIISGRLHLDKNGKGFMVCQRDKYLKDG